MEDKIRELKSQIKETVSKVSEISDLKEERNTGAYETARFRAQRGKTGFRQADKRV